MCFIISFGGCLTGGLSSGKPHCSVTTPLRSLVWPREEAEDVLKVLTLMAFCLVLFVLGGERLTFFLCLTDAD